MNSLSKHQRYDVVIVGAGFSGSMVAVHLVKRLPELRVLVIDKSGAFGRGVAYGTDDAQHLLNVPVGKISAFAEEPDHFFQWLQQHRAELCLLGVKEISREAFMPRLVYGQYVQDIFEQARREAPGLETAEGEIEDIEARGEGLVLLRKDGQQYVASKAVLALGNFGPGDPPTKDRRFHSSARYLNQPWSPTMLQQVSREDDILILGSGLTALDLLVSLEANKTRGTIYMVSRHGLYPQSHQSYTPQPNRFRDRELPHTVRGLLRLLRQEVQAAAAEGCDWRAVIDALRPHTQELWRSLNLEERRRFMRHARTFWESHRHRVAPAVLAVKDRMAERGQLVCYKARVVSIVEAGDGLDVKLVERPARREVKLRVAYVVNCTGPECNYYQLKDPLVVNLLARGLINPDPLFLGLMTAPNGAVCDYLGQPSTNLFTLGSVKKGMLFETTAVPELRTQAKALAEELSQAWKTGVPGPGGPELSPPSKLVEQAWHFPSRNDGHNVPFPA